MDHLIPVKPRSEGYAYPLGLNTTTHLAIFHFWDPNMVTVHTRNRSLAVYGSLVLSTDYWPLMAMTRPIQITRRMVQRMRTRTFLPEDDEALMRFPGSSLKIHSLKLGLLLVNSVIFLTEHKTSIILLRESTL